MIEENTLTAIGSEKHRGEILKRDLQVEAARGDARRQIE